MPYDAGSFRLGLSTFGCAKHKLFGVGVVPQLARGNISLLHDPKNDETVGALVRTKDNVAPIIVSAGYKITLEESIELALRTAKGYRIPEPTRRAHNLVNAFRKSEIRVHPVTNSAKENT